MSNIYILRAIGAGKIKIGISDDVPRRLAEIQAMCPVPLELIDTLERADFDAEATMHRLVREHWSHGEWFDEEALPKVQRHFEIVRAAVRALAETLATSVPEGQMDAVKSNLYAAGAANIAHELTNITGQSIMDRSAA